MEINSQTNVFHQGLDMDTDISMLPEGKYRYAENIRLLTDSNGTTGVIQNIEHIRKYANGISADEQILGTSVTLIYDHENKSTKEVGIVVTKKYINTKVYNTVYIVEGFDSINITTTPILIGYLELDKNVKIVCNYETANVSNIYITDGNTPIKVINIQDQLSIIEKQGLTEVLDPTRYDITPGAVMIPFKMVGKIDGVLPAGAVQYAYQLFNQHGSITAVSALSEVIPIVNKSSSLKTTKGGVKEDITNMGCQIKAQFQNDGRFDRIRIFTIVYLDNTSIPNIYIANELQIPNVGNNEFVDIIYNDTGNGYLSQITIDEFNALTPVEFSAVSIEKMQNRLFASNIQELTWDIDFDARAYRCDKDRNVELQSVTTGEIIKGILKSDGNIYDSTETNKITIPEEHDCINPSNVDILGNNQIYTYFPTGLGNNVIRGGLGPNVQYRFTYTKIPLSSANITDRYDYSQTVDIAVDTIQTSLTTYYEDGSVCKIHNLPQQGIIANYADPYICANFLGYQRDEIYRFGIIFYNNKNIPTPVHWIGDIKMPSIHCSDDTSTLYYPFHYGEDGKELNGYVLGIEFTVKNIPDEVFAYEIVRCDRTETDRTVVCQGALGATMAYTHAGEKDNNYGNIDTRPLIQLMLPKDEIYMVYGTDKEDEIMTGNESIRQDCFEFASPEMCIGGEGTINLVNKSYLNPLYYTSSVTDAAWKDGGYYRTTGIRPTNIYDIASSDGEIITNAYDDDTRMYPYPRIYSETIMDADYQIHNVTCLTLGQAEDEGNKERCLVAKCYKMQTLNELADLSQKSLFIEDAIVSKMIPFNRKFNDLKNYVQFVGDYAYINSSYQYGFAPNHGICGVLVAKGFDGFIELTPYGENIMEFNEFCTSAICNIKRNIVPYNGNAYVNRQTSVYQSCGCFNTENMTNKVLCFGGDTYLGIFDYQNTVVTQSATDIADEDKNKICHVSYIPLESVINLNYRTTDSFSKLSNGDTGENRVQIEPMSYQAWIQKEPLYGYNSVYSQTSGSKQYIAKGMYFEDDIVINNRIMVSEQKTNNEMIDSWSNFKVANFLDVDTKFGPITNIKNFKNRLYYWQNSAVGIAAVNERSLITDNNSAALTLGTGGILSRYDYITELNGSSIYNDKSIVNSSSYLYWYDFDKNVICQLGEGLNTISKTNNVQSYLNSLHSAAKTNPVSFYDNKYNEVWFRLYDKALIFNEKLNTFTSFYTHNPNWFFPFSDKLITIKDNNMYYLHNIYDVNSDIVEERIANIQFVVNKDITNTKVFDNVSFSADLKDNNNKIPNIVKNVWFKTKTQETDKIDYNSIDIREDNYRFSIGREKVKNEDVQQLSSQSYLSRMRGKYLICDYTFDCNSNREFKIPYIKTTYRYSML